MPKLKGETGAEYARRRLHMTQQERDLDDLQRIKAYFYGFKKDINRMDAHWLLEMAEKAIKNL